MSQTMSEPTPEMIDAGRAVLRIAQKRHANLVVYAEADFCCDLYKAMQDAAPERCESTELSPHTELIYAVQTKWPGETRHETALRYISESEAKPHPNMEDE